MFFLRSPFTIFANMSESSIISKQLASEHIGKLIWQYSLPAIVGTVVMSLFNIVDRIFIGQGVGPMAISGLALTFPFMNVLTSFGMLVGSGSAARISIALGAGNRDRAESILAHAFMLTFVVSGVAIVASCIFMDDLLRLFGGTEHTSRYAEEYMRIIIPFAFFSALSYNFNSIMRATGYPKQAMWTMIICALVNVVLDPLFIFVFNWGIRGAAWATNIAYGVGSVWVLAHFMRPKSNLRFRPGRFRPDLHIVKSILSLGLSPFSMHMALSFVIVLINVQLLKYGGDLAIGAYGITNSITSLVVMIIIGLNQGIQPIIGYNYGAQLYGRMFSVLKKSVIIGTCVSTLGFLAGMPFPDALVGLFTNDSEMTAMASNALRITVAAFPIVGFQIVAAHFFQSIGKAFTAIVLSLTRQLIFLIPGLFILPRLFDLNGAWAAQPAADLLATLATAIILAVFLKKETARQAQPANRTTTNNP